MTEPLLPVDQTEEIPWDVRNYPHALPPIALLALDLLAGLSTAVGILAAIDPTQFGIDGAAAGSQVGRACVAATSIQVSTDVLTVATRYGSGVPSMLPHSIALIDCLSALAGFGTPYTGDDIKFSAEHLSAASEQMATALPNKCWQGRASDAYADRTATLTDQTYNETKYHKALATVIENQADLVTTTRMALAAIRFLLFVGYCCEVYAKVVTAQNSGPGNPIWDDASRYAVTMSKRGVGTAGTLLGAVFMASCYYFVPAAESPRPGVFL